MRWAAAVVLLSGVAWADAAWLAAPARTPARQTFSVLLGSEELGVAARTTGVTLEGTYRFRDQLLELRVAHAEPIGQRFYWSAGATGLLVPDLALDLGIGGHAGLGLTAGLFEAGGTTGVEVFARGSARFQQRVQLGLVLRLGAFEGRVLARAGVDFAPGQAFAVRAELALALGFVRN